VLFYETRFDASTLGFMLCGVSELHTSDFLRHKRRLLRDAGVDPDESDGEDVAAATARLSGRKRKSVGKGKGRGKRARS